MSQTTADLSNDIVDALKAEIEVLKNKLAVHESAKSATDKELEALHGQLSQKNIELGEALGLVEQMQTAIASQDSVDASSDQPVITFEKKKYRVQVPSFKFRGDAYTAEDLKSNKELVGILVKKESNILKLVE
jgi:ribosomal protein L9